jgi:hypothetical protein
MPRYIARFIKDVLGDNGQTCEVCQTTIELDARSDMEAEQKAKERFCETHATHDWSLHADCMKVDPADFPS